MRGKLKKKSIFPNPEAETEGVLQKKKVVLKNFTGKHL